MKQETMTKVIEVPEKKNTHADTLALNDNGSRRAAEFGVCVQRYELAIETNEAARRSDALETWRKQ